MKPWTNGDTLTRRDAELLRPLQEKAAELGRTPLVGEVASSAQIKARFRLWKNAVQAAGLPSLNDPEQTRLREKEHAAQAR